MHAEGGCFCGNIRYEISADPVMKAQCHCRECQYISGGAPNMFMAIPAAGFHYIKGQPKSFARKDLERPVVREFCGDCGTALTSRPPGFPAVVVKVGTLDNPALMGGPDMAIYMIDAQSFHQAPPGKPQFERLPG
jgi:hypothetical protein